MSDTPITATEANLRTELVALKMQLAEQRTHMKRMAERVINPPIMLTEKAEDIRAACTRDMKRAFRPIIGKLYWRLDDGS